MDKAEESANITFYIILAAFLALLFSQCSYERDWENPAPRQADVDIVGVVKVHGDSLWREVYREVSPTLDSEYGDLYVIEHYNGTSDSTYTYVEAFTHFTRQEWLNKRLNQSEITYTSLNEVLKNKYPQNNE